jgi:GNAT superfamily N-acetyltransferase
MDLVQVLDKRFSKEFLEVPITIYKNDPKFIRPLNKDVNDVFDPKKNKAFRFGECARWLLKENDILIGRIAAFVNKEYSNKGDEQPTGGIGFFECINNQQAADMLFDVAKSWLIQRGMEAMDGPINFGERDRWWGLVTQGFKPPVYLMNYNLPYYQALFENYGFKKFYNQVCWHLFVQVSLNEKFIKQDEKYTANPEYRIIHIRKKQLQKFAIDFSIVYNKAWAKHEGNKQLNKDVAYKMFQEMKPVMDENLIWFVYHRDEPIAFWVNLPELNQIFKHLNGRFGPFEKLKYLWLKKKGVCNKFTGIAFGVIPEYQGKGIDYYMIAEGAKVIQEKKQYNELELQWQGDFNPKILNISRHIGAKQSRMLTTYRYLFDPGKEFKRHPILS